MTSFFSDDFHRADSSQTGNGWVDTAVGSGTIGAGISSNRQYMVSNNNGQPITYRTDLSQTNDIAISGQFSSSTLSDGYYKVGILSSEGYHTSGYYITLIDQDFSGDHKIAIGDDSRELASAPFTFNNTDQFAYEWDITSRNWSYLYVWDASTGSKPFSPTLAWTNGGADFTPTTTGNRFYFTSGLQGHIQPTETMFTSLVRVDALGLSASVLADPNTEVTFISGVTSDAKVAATSFGTWDGPKLSGPNQNDPATYDPSQSFSTKWGGTTLSPSGTAGGTVTYSFDAAAHWSASEKAALKSGLALWSAEANIAFNEVATNGQFVLLRSSPGDGSGTAFASNSTVGSGVEGAPVGGSSISIDTSIPKFAVGNGFEYYGGYPYQTLLHEEGHVLGLGHGGPYNGGNGFDPNTQQFSPYDTRLWALMSYIDPTDQSAKYYDTYQAVTGVSGTDWGSTADGHPYGPTTPMMLDIQAAQRLYGAATSGPLAGGGQTFGFHSTVGGDIAPYFDFTMNTHPVITIWDGGLGNALDLSGWSAPATIDLRPGTFTSADGMVNNIGIAAGTIIETAIGGSGDDIITGNDPRLPAPPGPNEAAATAAAPAYSGANVLHGGAGDDVITGRGGDDRLYGDSGNDILYGDFSTVEGNISANIVGTIVQFDGAGFDATRVESPTVVNAGGQYKLLYGGLPFGNNYQIGLATSGDGTNWTKYSDDPVISNAGSQAWASFREIPRTLIYENGTYKLWFYGDNSNLSSDPGYATGFGYATSADGVHWTMGDDDPIRSQLNTPAGNGIDLREVVKFGGEYHAYYIDHNPDGDVLYHAVSLDGAHFSDDLQVGIASGYTLEAATTADYGGSQFVFAIWQNGGNHFYGTSTDGLHFTIGGTLSLPSDFAVSDVLFDGGAVDIFGAAGVGNVNWSYGNTVIRLATGFFSSMPPAGDDTLLGGTGDDTLYGGPGNDTLDGGADIDTAVFAGPRSAYTMTAVSDGIQVSGPDGIDTLTNIEFLAFDDATIAVNNPPRITSNGAGDSASVSVAENTTSVTTVTASDPDADTALAYSISGGPDATKFQINAMSGVLSFITAPDFENPADVDHNNSYIVQVRASDGSLFDDQTITVNVTDAVDSVQWAGSPDLGVRSPPYQVAGVGDFNNDHTDDVLWRDPITGRLDEWHIVNGQWAGSTDLGSHGADWQVAGIGDLDGDGTGNILWRNPTTGQTDEWRMGNGNWAGSVPLGSHGADWQVAGIGDFNNDGTDDILWRNPSTGQMDEWRMGNGNWAGSLAFGSHGTDWIVAGIGDFNHDGNEDVLWRNPTTGKMDEWKLVNGQWAGSVDLGSFSAAWQVAAVKDFNGDGTADVLFRNPSTGQVEGWVMQNGQWASSFSLGSMNPAFQIVGSGDFNHSFSADVLWRNPSTGQTGEWLLAAT